MNRSCEELVATDRQLPLQPSRLDQVGGRRAHDAAASIGGSGSAGRRRDRVMLAVKCALLLFGGEILPRVRNVTHEKRVLHRSSFRRMISPRLAARLSSLRRPYGVMPRGLYIDNVVANANASRATPATTMGRIPGPRISAPNNIPCAAAFATNAICRVFRNKMTIANMLITNFITTQ